MDYSYLQDSLAGSKLEALLAFCDSNYLDQLTHGDFPRWRQHLSKFPAINVADYDFSETVRFGHADGIDAETSDILKQLLLDMLPWRKGPFEVLGIFIDSEWRSNLKWARVNNQIASLAGKKVLDVGCGNGYYGFRMLAHEPEQVIGIDPHLAYVAQFWALKQFVPHLPLAVLPCSLEQVTEPLRGFDTVFSMGVIYHRRSPIDHLKQCYQCLVPGGQLVLETLYVDGPAGYSLIPAKKYARMSNVWFIPSIGTLEQWLFRCGFSNIEVIDESMTTSDEQRKTAWMPFESFEDAIDKTEPTKTIEGSPAPKRVVILATSS